MRARPVADRPAARPLHARCAAYRREMLGQSSGMHCSKQEFRDSEAVFFPKNKRDSEAGEVDLQHGQSILFGPRTGQASYSFHVADDRLSYTNNAAAAAAAANQSSSMGCGLLGLSGLEPIDGPGFRLCMSSRAGLTCSYPQAQKQAYLVDFWL